VSKNVFANGMEVSAKNDDNKSIAAMPDTCLSPPSPPAGPVPLPYPNTAMASDTSDGSKTVKIGGGEVGLKNVSNYKKSTGDEAATKTLGMGVVSHNIQGPMKHAAWSMDVKFEGKNAIRHMDLTTHNHINTDNLTATMDGASVKPGEVSELCKELDLLNQQEVAKAKVEAANLSPSKKKAMKDKGWALTTAKIQMPAGVPGSGTWNAVSNADLVPENGSSSYKTDYPTGQIPDCAGLKNKTSRKATKKRKAVKKGDPKRWTERGKDSEAKLLGPMMALPPAARVGAKITMKVFHVFNATPDKPDSLPCWSCREAICGAVQCKIEVTLCTNDNRAVDAKTMCEDGEPKPKGADSGDKQIPPAPGTKSAFWSDAGFGPRA
jgi:hypothetical protein